MIKKLLLLIFVASFGIKATAQKIHNNNFLIMPKIKEKAQKSAAIECQKTVNLFPFG